jgi:hypothetical protein
MFSGFFRNYSYVCEIRLCYIHITCPVSTSDRPSWKAQALRLLTCVMKVPWPIFLVVYLSSYGFLPYPSDSLFTVMPSFDPTAWVNHRLAKLQMCAKSSHLLVTWRSAIELTHFSTASCIAEFFILTPTQALISPIKLLPPGCAVLYYSSMLNCFFDRNLCLTENISNLNYENLPLGCAILYYMLDAQLFLRPQLMPHREHK